MEFEHTIASARMKAQLSQQEMAEKMQMILRTYRSKENGERAMSAEEGIRFSLITGVEAKKIDFNKPAQKKFKK